MAGRIPVVLVDDQEVVRVGLQKALESRTNLQVLKETDSTEEALKTLQNIQSEVLQGAIQWVIVIVEPCLLQGGGFAFIREVRDEYSSFVRMLAYTSYYGDYVPEAALRAGTSGCVYKREGLAVLQEAITEILQGKVSLPAPVIDRLLARSSFDFESDRGPLSVLTEREFEVFTLMGQGFAPDDIARKLGILKSTVMSHRASILKKLDCITHEELQYRAIMNFFSHRGSP